MSSSIGDNGVSSNAFGNGVKSCSSDGNAMSSSITGGNGISKSAGRNGVKSSAGGNGATQVGYVRKRGGLLMVKQNCLHNTYFVYIRRNFTQGSHDFND